MKNKQFLIILITTIILPQKTYTLRQNCYLADDYILTQSQATLFGDTNIVDGPMTNQALNFDGDGDYATLPSCNIGGTSSITFLARWFSISFYSRVFDLGQNGANAGKNNIYVCNKEENYQFLVEVKAELANNKKQLDLSSIVLNEWKHYLLIIKGDQIIIYVDGTEVTSNFYENYGHSEGVIHQLRDSNLLGKSNFSSPLYFHGEVDEFNLYNYEVTTEQRECIYDICNVQYCYICNGASNICHTCIGNREPSTNCLCPDGTFNTDQNICPSCDHECQTCSTSSDNCDTCKGDRISPPSCICPNNYYDDGSSYMCTQCPYIGCKTCSGGPNCDTCYGSTNNDSSRDVNTCECPLGYYSDLDNNVEECQVCPFEGCYSCSNNLQCDQCIGIQNHISSRFNQDCICPQGYYSDILQQEDCLTCQNQCLSCETQSNNCIICKGDRIQQQNNDCTCSYHQYDDITSTNCQECDITCEICNFNDGCTECRNNRIQNTDLSEKQKCICSENDIDHYSDLNTYWCTTCTESVITPQFSNDYSMIIVQFYVDINVPNFDSDINISQQTNELCEYIFDTELLNKLGQNVKCRISQSQQQVQIYLGLQPTILNDVDKIEFQLNTIQRDGCSSNQFLNSYYQNTLKLGQIPLPPSAELTLPTSKVTLCQQIDIQLINIINDGLRGLKNLFWSINQTSASNTEKLQEILDNQNQNNSKAIFLSIPMLTLQEYQSYELQVFYENFAGESGITQFTIETLSTKGTYAQIQQIQPFVFKNWKQNELIADINLLDCKSGKLEYIDQSMLVEWVDITNNIDQPLISYNTAPSEKLSTYTIEKYSSIPGQTYQIEIKVNIKDEPLMESKHFVDYLIEVSDLQVYIEGGNRLQAYANELQLQGHALDPDVPEEIQKDGVSLNWECVNMLDQGQCKNIGGVILPLGTEDNLLYEKKIFEPYNTFQFTLIGDNNQKSNSDKVIIIVIETDLPVLTVSIPQQIRNQKINKNDDLQMQVTSSQDPDEAFYSLIIIYKFEVVATKSYNYNKFAFQIWDIFNDFETDETEFILRVSVYDPQYFMPSQSSFTTNINYSPLPGDVIITPNQGISLQTKFTILCENFYDEDQPLTYKYSYYTQQDQYQKEIQQGSKQVQVYKNILQDFSNQNSFETILPYGQDEQLLILVTVSDSLGAIANVTQSIQISKYSENYDTSLQHYQQLYQESQNLEQQQKLNQINLLVQDLNQLFLKDDGSYKEILQEQSQLQQQYLQFKKTVHDDLSNYIGNIYSKTLEDQVLKSITILQNAGGNLAELQTDEELLNQIEMVDNVINEQQQILKNLVNENLLNQGDNSVSRKQTSVNEILGNSLKFMDTLSSNIQVDKQNEQDNQQQKQQLSQLYDSSKLIQQTIQIAMLPNSDQITYNGVNIYQEVQVQTQKNVQNQYLQQETQGIQLLNKDDVSTQLNIDTKPNTIYKSSGTAFKSNPFINDKGFPYSDQNNGLQDIDIIIDGENEDNHIELKYQQISISFFKSDEEDEGNLCIQKSTNDLEEKWESANCITKEDEFGKINCKCQSLNPTTVINDINNIYQDSQIDQVTGKKGFQALIQLKFWETIIFYVYIAKFVTLIYLIYQGRIKDKQNLQKIQQLQQSEEKEINKDEIENNSDKNSHIIIENSNQENDFNQENFQNNGQNNYSNNKQNNQNEKTNNKIDYPNFAIKFKRKRRKSKYQEKTIENDKKSTNQIQDNQSNANLDQTAPISSQRNRKKQVSQINNEQLFDDINTQRKQSQTSQNQIINFQDFNNDNNDKNSNSNDKENSIINSNSLNEEQKNQKEIKIKKQPLEALFVFHSFFSIQLLHMDTLSRPSRYILYFIRINLLLAISAIFSQEMTYVQSIIFSILGSILLSLPQLILQLLLKSQKIALQIIGLILSIVLFIIAIYTVLVISAILGIDQANQWVLSYLTSFSISFFIIEPIQGYIQAYFIELELKSNKSNFFKNIFGTQSIINYLIEQ